MRAPLWREESAAHRPRHRAEETAEQRKTDQAVIGDEAQICVVRRHAVRNRADLAQAETDHHVLRLFQPRGDHLAPNRRAVCKRHIAEAASQQLLLICGLRLIRLCFRLLRFFRDSRRKNRRFLLAAQNRLVMADSRIRHHRRAHIAADEHRDARRDSSQLAQTLLGNRRASRNHAVAADRPCAQHRIARGSALGKHNDRRHHQGGN